MPSTAPTLTWAQTATYAPTNPLVVQDVLDAIELAVIAHADWSVTSSAPNELEIQPASGPLVGMRILLATGIDTAQKLSPHSLVAGVLYMGIAPDGGTLGDAHGSDDPYGAARWSKYWKISGVITGSDEVNNVHLVASKEVFSVWLQEADAETWWGGAAGAIIDPPDDSDGEGTPGRVYGMFVSGTDVIDGGFWQTGASFLGATGGGNADPMIGIFQPSDTGTWARLQRADDAASDVAPRYQTIGGTRVTTPVLMHYKGTPYNAVGVLRQMRRSQDGMMRRVVQDAAAADKSFHVAGSSVLTKDTLSFDNG